MNAQVRSASARTVVCSAPPMTCPNALTLPTPRPVSSGSATDADADELIDRLVDTLIASFSLTEWERQVLNQALFGRSCPAIAEHLGIRETTVHKHMHRIFAETKTDGRKALYDLGLRLAARRAIFMTMDLAA